MARFFFEHQRQAPNTTIQQVALCLAHEVLDLQINSKGKIELYKFKWTLKDVFYKYPRIIYLKWKIKRTLKSLSHTRDQLSEFFNYS